MLRTKVEFSKVALLLNVLCKSTTGLAFEEFYLGPQRVSCECERCSFVEQSFVLSSKNCKFVLKRQLVHLCVFILCIYLYIHINIDIYTKMLCVHRCMHIYTYIQKCGYVYVYMIALARPPVNLCVCVYNL